MNWVWMGMMRMKAAAFVVTAFLIAATLAVATISGCNESSGSQVIFRTITVQEGMSFDDGPQEVVPTAAVAGVAGGIDATEPDTQSTAGDVQAAPDIDTGQAQAAGGGGPSCDSSYSDGYNAGYNQRYNYQNGFQSGYDEGYEAGLQDGASDYSPF